MVSVRSATLLHPDNVDATRQPRENEITTIADSRDMGVLKLDLLYERTVGITEDERLTLRKSKRLIEGFVCMPCLFALIHH